MRLALRDYQDETLLKVNQAIAAGENRPAIVHATGLGKTVTFSSWIAQRLAEQPRQRALVLVGGAVAANLATQARDKIHSIAPHLRPGIVMANQRDHDRPVVVASVQTLSGSQTRNGMTSWPRREQIHNVGTIVVDEAHHAAAPTWRALLDYYGAFNGVPTLGCTATMSREDGRGLGEIWHRVVDVRDTIWGIRNGYLADVRGIRVHVPDLDLTGVHIRAGDLQQEETATAMLNADTGGAIIKSIYEFAPDRRGVVFAPNVATAVQWAEEMNDAGIATGVIIGTTTRDERAKIYAQFEAGKLRWLCTVMVLTEGWDAPWADCAVIARPTQVARLYQQMVGRILRLWAAGGKVDALVLDVCGATDLHGLASLQDLSEDRQIKPRPGQSLLEAMDEFEDDFDATHQGLDALGFHAPPVHSVVGVEIDMFGKSHSVWLQTDAGTWFVPAGDMFFFLWRKESGLYTLGMTPKERAERATPIQDDLDLEIGMALAEQCASDYAPQHAGRDASWRQTGPARPGQRADLRRYQRKAPKTMSAAQAFDEINRGMATVRLGG